MSFLRLSVLSAVIFASQCVTAADGNPSVSNPQLLWGDTHLHTNNSFDAFLNGNKTVSPDDAYRFARGEPVIHAYTRTRVQLETPLDFLVVTDHAEFLGGVKDIYYSGVQMDDANLLERLVIWFRERQMRDAIDSGEGPAFFSDQLPEPGEPRQSARTWVTDQTPAVPGADVSARNAWHALLDTADRYNEPGVFTAFSGWEWSSQPGGANLHRVIVSDADAATGRRFMPFASIDSPYPDDLWQWLSRTEAETGVNFLAIPHNPNISKGLMFDTETLRGDPIDKDYAELRMRFESLVEVTQIKGDSETHESLSPEDEFAQFETYAHYLTTADEAYVVNPGDYVRTALRTGLALGEDLGINPFKFGMIGSTDSHTGLSTAEEANFWGKFAFDSIPENKRANALGNAPGWAMSASGLAAVWAAENTREAIMAAMSRRETYATTGTRIRVRFFGGWQFSEADLQNSGLSGYSKGVPMGGTIESSSVAASAPSFMVLAGRDPQGANLDRIQIVKGWTDADGATHEQVYDVSWSDGRALIDGKLTPLSDTVDRTTGRNTDDHGAAELSVIWRDPAFDANRPAFYYARILQIPTARHSLLDRIALGVENADDFPDVLQERAYTSPIWYSP